MVPWGDARKEPGKNEQVGQWMYDAGEPHPDLTLLYLILSHLISPYPLLEQMNPTLTLHYCGSHPYLTLLYLILSHLISPYPLPEQVRPTLTYITVPDLISSHLISSHLTLPLTRAGEPHPYLTLLYLILSHLISPYPVLLTPYTLHLTPYTLHLTPYTLHLTPYTLHLTPYPFPDQASPTLNQASPTLSKPQVFDSQSWLQKTKLGVEGIKECWKQVRIQDTRHEGGGEEEAEDGEEAVSLCDRLMLVSSLYSIETCMSFQQLYQVLFLQFLGVPLALISVDGILAGCAGMVILPLVGSWADGGHNAKFLGVPLALISVDGILAGCAGMVILPLVGSWADGGHNAKRRKMIAMFGGLVVFVSGLVLLITASCVKIQMLDAELFDIHMQTDNFSSVAPNETDEFFQRFPSYGFGNETAVLQPDFGGGIDDGVTVTEISSSSSSSSSVGIVVLSILGFMCLDMGFDLTIALSRASILDVVPKFQHKPVLVLATIVQSVAGFICASIGCIDLPTLLGSLFQTDGTAATLIFFCCVLMTTSFVSFSLMGVANYRLNSQKEIARSRTVSTADSTVLTNTGKRESISQAFDKLEERGSQEVQGSACRGKNLQDNCAFATSPVPTGNADVNTRPLLSDSLKTNYLTINKDTPVGALSEVEPARQPLLSDSLQGNQLEAERSSSGKTDDYGATSTAGADVAGEGESSTDHCPEHADEETSEEIAEEDGVMTVLEAINQPYSMAMTPLEALNVLEIEHIMEEVREEEEDPPKPGADEWEDRYRKMKQKLLILCVSCFFTLGASMSFSMYAFNSFNHGIMHGDPAALPGSEGRHNYEAGLKLGSFGNMVFYSAFLLISLSNTKIIRTIDPTSRERNSQDSNSRPFASEADVLPLDHRAPQMPAGDEESGQKRSHTGRVMTLIGLLVPAHFCLLSIMMGPLMEATGNPWIPLFYCLGTSSVSLGIFSMLFFV
ncbi:hypothetical protein EGW08_005746 [Elysia chlorotica]|uniref:Uncharacterized protein n=1 Tax=Elysia chlorotica TaxID=188477 RepID=A0A433TY48_ELYCH|nr:hypothetical protein EGW08_005746 [Elysia chlorotica]